MSYFVPVTVSNPPSGLSLYFSEEGAQGIAKYAGLNKLNDLRLLPPECVVNENELVLTWRVAKPEDPINRSSVIHKNGGKAPARHAYRIVHKVVNQLDGFGAMEAKLYATKDNGQIQMQLQLNRGRMPMPVTRSRKGRRDDSLAPTENQAPVVPKPETVLVLLQVGNQELSFNLPVHEAFVTSLEWTQKGYKC